MISQLRRATYRYPPRSEALKKQKIGPAQYKCASCQNDFRPKDLVADHIIPIVDPAEGFKDWNSWIERGFPEVEGWQWICRPCHKSKSDDENKVRTEARRQQVKKKKKRLKNVLRSRSRYK